MGSSVGLERLTIYFEEICIFSSESVDAAKPIAATLQNVLQGIQRLKNISACSTPVILHFILKSEKIVGLENLLFRNRTREDTTTKSIPISD
jgi:hypothetical protein